MLAGLGRTRRVLLGDTLLAGFTPDEIEVIFAHEIGHHVFRHIRKIIAGRRAVQRCRLSGSATWRCRLAGRTGRTRRLCLAAGLHAADAAVGPAGLRLLLEPLQNTGQPSLRAAVRPLRPGADRPRGGLSSPPSASWPG